MTATTSSLLNEVAAKIKYKLRLAIESCFEPLGMFVSSLFLSIPYVNSKVLGAILSAFFLVIALLLRRRITDKATKPRNIPTTASIPLTYETINQQG